MDHADQNMTEPVVKPAAKDAAVRSRWALAEASETTTYSAQKFVKESKPDEWNATTVDIENPLQSNFPIQPAQCLGVTNGSVPPESEAPSNMGDDMLVDEEEDDGKEVGEEDEASNLSEGEDLRVSPQTPIANPQIDIITLARPRRYP